MKLFRILSWGMFIAILGAFVYVTASYKLGLYKLIGSGEPEEVTVAQLYMGYEPQQAYVRVVDFPRSMGNGEVSGNIPYLNNKTWLPIGLRTLQDYIQLELVNGDMDFQVVADLLESQKQTPVLIVESTQINPQDPENWVIHAHDYGVQGLLVRVENDVYGLDESIVDGIKKASWEDIDTAKTWVLVESTRQISWISSWGQTLLGLSMIIIGLGLGAYGIVKRAFKQKSNL